MLKKKQKLFTINKETRYSVRKITRECKNEVHFVDRVCTQTAHSTINRLSQGNLFRLGFCNVIASLLRGLPSQVLS